MFNFLSVTAGAVFSKIGFVFVAILVLLVMILIHEFGHYLAGKILKFKINEFSVGFGKAIFKKQCANGETFSLRLIPLGGYCAFEGEDEDNQSPQAFNNQKPWRRLIVLFAGAFFNFIFALIIVVITFLSFGAFKPVINTVFDSSSSEISQENILQKGDILLEIENKEIYFTTDLTKGLADKSKNEFVNILISRNGEERFVRAVIRDYKIEKDGEMIVKTGLGVTFDSTNYKTGFFDSIAKAFVYCCKLSVMLLAMIGSLITGALGISAIGGPVTTIVQTTQIISMGFNYLLEIVALIGVNLAVFNLLPIPSLDGSRMVFTTVEWIRGKPINRKIESYIHFAGLLLLFTFVIFIDIFHFFS